MTMFGLGVIVGAVAMLAILVLAEIAAGDRLDWWRERCARMRLRDALADIANMPPNNNHRQFAMVALGEDVAIRRRRIPPGE